MREAKISVKHYAPNELRTISTTLTNAEYHKFKATGLKWNRLIRMGATLAAGNFHTQTNERLNDLEKGQEKYKALYYEVKREMIQKELFKDNPTLLSDRQ